MRDLSILVPSRNEPFLRHTIEDVLANIEADTEIIAVCDERLPVEPIPDHPRLTLVLPNKVLGQRGATNLAAQLSNAKYIMKLDGHCRVSKGFDVALMNDCQPNWMMIPMMYNLHVFDWQCNACKNRTYQGPTPTKCEKCSKSAGFEKIMVWEPRWSRKTEAYRFTSDLHFAYWGELMHRPEIQAQGDVHDTMSFLGACQLMERDYFWKLGGCDLESGIWGQWATEWSAKVWLSEGEVKVSRKAWFSHLFRTQGADFSFPYPLSHKDQEKARARSRTLWLENTWEGQKYPLSWLIEKFAPVPDWSEEAIANLKKGEGEKGWKHEQKYNVADSGIHKRDHLGVARVHSVIESSPAIIRQRFKPGILYYTDNLCDDRIMEACQRQLLKASNGIPIVSVSLGKAIDFGENIVIERTRGAKTLFLQLLAGLERLKSDYVFYCEHDCAYTKSHFDFIPPTDNNYYYNEHTYKVRATDGQAVFYYTKQLSGFVANRLLALEHYYKRLSKMAQNVRELTAMGEPVRNDGHSRYASWEPGQHAYPRGIDNYTSIRFMSALPNIDIRDHGTNYTKTRWDVSEFRDKRTCKGWTPVEEIPYWGRTKNRFWEFLEEMPQLPLDASPVSFPEPFQPSF